MSELQSALSERDAEILRLKEEVKALTAEREDTVTQVSVKGLFHTKQRFFFVSDNQTYLNVDCGFSRSNSSSGQCAGALFHVMFFLNIFFFFCVFMLTCEHPGAAHFSGSPFSAALALAHLDA